MANSIGNITQISPEDYKKSLPGISERIEVLIGKIAQCPPGAERRELIETYQLFSSSYNSLCGNEIYNINYIPDYLPSNKPQAKKL